MLGVNERDYSRPEVSISLAHVNSLEDRRQVPSQDAWTRAKERYVEDLTEDERRLYSQPTPEMLFYNASAAQKRYSAGSTSFSALKKLEPLWSAIEQYSQAMDVYANAYPLVLSPLWGSIRVVLHIAGEFGKYFDKIIDVFERIGDVLPQFRVYEKLFSSHERLIQALSVAYVDIITFCSKCKAVFRQGQRFPKTTFKVAFKLVWKPFERQFGQVIDGFREHRKNVEKEAGLSHMIEAADFRALVVANQQQIGKQRKFDAQVRLLAAVPSVDTEARHRKLLGLRYPGTGEWLLRDEIYIAWQQAQDSSYLCCRGIPGCGKSVLASVVIDALRTLKDVRVLSFYCDYSDQRTLQMPQILGTILKQLLSPGTIPDSIEKQMTQAFEDSASSLALTELVDLVCSAIQLHPTVCFVLDGLDECEQEVRDHMVAFLERLSGMASTTIKLFIFCREEDRISRALRGYPYIHVTAACSESDIRSFIAGSVRSRIERGKLRLRNANLERDIVLGLTEKANGMFLWVFFQLEDICDAHSDAEIRDVLHSLPDGIFATYERILHKIVKKKAKTVASKMFTWITSAQRPLTVPELQEAVAFDTSDKAWDEDKIPHEDLMMESCRGLVVRDDADNTVRLAHYTVQQYLYSDETPQGRSFLLNTGKDYLGQMCITYLRFSDFETQIVPRKAIQTLDTAGLLRSGGAAWIPSVLGFKDYMFDFAYKLSRGNPALRIPSIDWIRHFHPSAVERGKLPAEFADRYALLRYIIDYWMYHTKVFENHEAEGKAIQDLAYNRNLPFEFRPWGANRHHGPYGCVVCSTGTVEGDSDLRYMSLYHYAAEAGHWLLMEPFADMMTAHENTETLLITCREGQPGIALRLILGQIRFKGTPKQAIITAAQFGHVGVLKCLLTAYPGSRFRSRTSNNAPDIEEAWLLKAFLIAATKGHKEVVDLLLDWQVPINRKNAESKRTAISSAAAMGHQEVVKTLLQHGASIGDPNNVENSALYLAAEGGHCSIIQILVDAQERAIERSEHQVTPVSDLLDTTSTFKRAVERSEHQVTPVSDLLNATSSSNRGYTALNRAAAKGHAKVVEVPVKHGADTAKPAKFVDVEMDDSDRNYNAVHLAALAGSIETLEVLRQAGVLLEIKTNKGRTPLHVAAAKGDEPMVRWLLRNSSTFDVMDNNGTYPIQLAVQNLHYDAVCVLSDYEASASGARGCEDSHQPGTLEAAINVFQKDQAILKKLLSYNHFPRVSLDLETALEYAKRKNEGGAVDLIQQKLDNSPNIELT